MLVHQTLCDSAAGVGYWVCWGSVCTVLECLCAPEFVWRRVSLRLRFRAIICINVVPPPPTLTHMHTIASHLPIYPGASSSGNWSVSIKCLRSFAMCGGRLRSGKCLPPPHVPLVLRFEACGVWQFRDDVIVTALETAVRRRFRTLSATHAHAPEHQTFRTHSAPAAAAGELKFGGRGEVRCCSTQTRHCASKVPLQQCATNLREKND